MNGQGRGSLTEVFCTVNYTSCTRVCSLKILRHTFVYLVSGWPYWNTSQWKIDEIYPSLLKLLYLPKKSFFSHCLQSIYFYTVCLHDLILWCFLVWFLSTLACKFLFIYNLVSMPSFLHDPRWRQITIDSFLSPKNKKPDILCIKFSSTTNANVWKCLNHLSPFWKFAEFSLKSLKFVIPPWLREMFKFLFRLLEKAFVSHKIDLQRFYLCLPVSIHPGSYHYHQAYGNYSFCSRQHFSKICFPQHIRGGEGLCKQ